MKKAIKLLLIIGVLTGLVGGWYVFGPTIHVAPKKFIYIPSGSQYSDVKRILIQEEILPHYFIFEALAELTRYKKNIKPGKFKIENNSSLFQLLKMLHSGKQAAVRLVITKLRTKEDLANKLADNFELDPAQVLNFLQNNDSLKKFGVDSNTVMSLIIPNSYLFWWNASLDKILTKLSIQHQYFWDGERSKKAALQGLTPIQAYTMASIIEEETNMKSDKGKIASVYLNRMRKGMKLEADPTVKYAMRNFELKRILHGHLGYLSPYNTYQHTGLPPGPICTPSIETIEAVLDAPATDYIFFVAKPDFSGYSNFAATYEQHLLYAKAYQQALDQLMLKK